MYKCISYRFKDIKAFRESGDYYLNFFTSNLKYISPYHLLLSMLKTKECSFASFGTPKIFRNIKRCRLVLRKYFATSNSVVLCSENISQHQTVSFGTPKIFRDIKRCRLVLRKYFATSNSVVWYSENISQHQTVSFSASKIFRDIKRCRFALRKYFATPNDIICFSALYPTTTS